MRLVETCLSHCFLKDFVDPLQRQRTISPPSRQQQDEDFNVDKQKSL